MRPAKPRHEPTLVTERLTLRPVRDKDLDAIVAYAGDARVARMLARVPLPYTRTDARAFLKTARVGAAAGHELVLGIEHAGNFIGCIGLSGMPHRCELGYWLALPWWRRGFITEGSHAALAYAFDELGLRLVRSGVFIDNPASLRVQAKLGFRRIGFGLKRSLARGTEVAHIDTVLTAARFRATRQRVR